MKRPIELSRGDRRQLRPAAILGVLGAALMLYMILVEDEPGAIPLAMILGAFLWVFTVRLRARRRSS
ncbi:MAG: hypothetical protein OXT73_07595 [Bacteroidota bacterium]|nr:hypothetical protein [Bacteroidota bacterium]